MTTGTVLGRVVVSPDDDRSALWQRLASLAMAGGLPPLGGARLALAAVELVGVPAAPATVDVVATADHTEVEAVVLGGTGRGDGAAARLADGCRPHSGADGLPGQVAVVTAGPQLPVLDGEPSWQETLSRAAETGGLPALLSAALIALDDQAGHAAYYHTQMSQLQAELDATSQGLLALHSELSDQRDQLAQAHEAAQRASEAKAAFLASMSHEIRSPLNAMIGFTSLIQETTLTPEQSEYVGALTAAGGHLKDLVNGILDLSKVESGQLQLEEVTVDLLGCVEEAAGIVAPQAEAKNVALAVLAGPDVPAVIPGDPLRLRQVLLNLASNAVKFTDEGEVTIEVTLRPGPAEGERRLAFAVRDTGIGIPASALGRLFEPFTQADVSTTRHYGGTGLGLAISKQLTERMGGEITVSSTVGQGTTFTAEIPLRQPQLGSADDQPDEPLTGVRVLLVHPRPAIAEAARRHLQSWGAAVITAPSAAAAAARHLDWADARLAVIGASTPADLAAQAHALVSARGGGPLPVVGLTPLTWHPAGDSGVATWTVPAAPVRRTRLREAVLGALGHRETTGHPVHPPAPATTADPDHGLRVLVAEDDPANQRAISALLHRLGHEADLASDGEQAVAAITRGDYDLVFMDVQMPRLDGIAATRRVRAQHRGRRPPIVALTASATAATRQACLDAGMDGFLTKPIQLAGLTEAIKSSTRSVATVLRTPAPTSAARDPDAQQRQAPAERRVLYIDDNPALRRLVERILSKDPGTTVLTAADAIEGRELAATWQPHLILLDLHLAASSSEPLLCDLRADARTSAIPVVVVSGDSSPETVKRLAGLGATAHLAKPFDAQRLRAIAAKAMGTSR